jgi:hypothetical protein
MANGSHPLANAILATARTAAFIPGESPPEVITPIRFFLPSGLAVAGAVRLSVGTRTLGVRDIDAETVCAIVAGLGGA